MQDDWNPDWQSTTSSKVMYLVDKLKKFQETNRINGHSSDQRGVHDSHELHLSSERSYFNPSLGLEACSRSGNELSQMLTEKVIIFSQFLEHIHIIEQQVTFD